MPSLPIAGSSCTVSSTSNCHCCRPTNSWWYRRSNRGDSISTTLTRTFDLSSIETATLRLNIWFDVEYQWDYGYVQISTDEVYGSLGVQGKFRENSPLAPNSPYAASKASADLLARAYHMTYGVDVIITRCCNNYGPHQFPEKLIPLMTLNAINNHKLPVYGDGLYSRDWVHVLDHSRAIVLILEKGQGGEIYNIGANHEETNLDLVHRILRILNKPKSLIDFVRDRPAHDRRYAVDASRLRDELGWRPKVPFEEGLRETIKWYKDHRSWIKNLKTGDYMYYYQKMYSDREKTLDDL